MKKIIMTMFVLMASIGCFANNYYLQNRSMKKNSFTVNHIYASPVEDTFCKILNECISYTKEYKKKDVPSGYWIKFHNKCTNAVEVGIKYWDGKKWISNYWNVVNGKPYEMFVGNFRKWKFID